MPFKTPTKMSLQEKFKKVIKFSQNFASSNLSPKLNLPPNIDILIQFSIFGILSYIMRDLPFDQIMKFLKENAVKVKNQKWMKTKKIGLKKKIQILLWCIFVDKINQIEMNGKVLASTGTQLAHPRRNLAMPTTVPPKKATGKFCTSLSYWFIN